MGYCDGIIKESISPVCPDSVVPGVEQRGVIINRSDLDFGSIVFDAARPNIIKTISLKSGAKAYEIYVPGNNSFTGTTTTMEQGTNRNSFTNNVAFVVLDNGPDVCDKVIDALSTGEFVVILENKFKSLMHPTTPGDSAFQIFGYYQGLKATTLESDKYSEDTEGGWNVVLAETRVPRSGLFLFDIDLDTTRAALTSLLS